MKKERNTKKHRIVKSMLLFGILGVGSYSALKMESPTKVSAAAITNIPCSENSVEYYIDGPSSITITNISNLEEEVNSKYKIKKTVTECKGGFFESMTDATTTTVNGTISVAQNSGTSYRISYNTAYRDITVNVTPDESAPVLTTTLGSTGVVTNVNDPGTSASFLATFTAVDSVDGGVDVYYKDDTGINYDNNRFTVGTYTLIVGAVDSSGNEATYSFPVIVKDNDAPEILGADSFTSNMSSPITESLIRSQQSVSDNYDEVVPLTLKNDGFTGNEQTVGTYTIVYSAVDSSGNTAADKVVTVYVKDDIAPQITVVNKEFTVSASKYLTYEETLECAEATDNVDGNITESISITEDTYEANQHFLGTYRRVLQVIDAAGNVTEEVITIHVVDLDAPVLYVKNQLLVEGLILTEDQLVNIIAQVNNISFMSYSIRNNEYVGNEQTAGTYATAIAYVLEDGNEVELETNVIVSEKIEESETPDLNVEEEKFYETDEFKNICIYGGVGLLAVIAIILALSLNKKNKKGGRRK